MKDQESFKPYIPAEKITAEMTATSVIMGIILSVVFGAANAYLGLRVGMHAHAAEGLPSLAHQPVGHVQLASARRAFWRGWH